MALCVVEVAKHLLTFKGVDVNAEDELGTQPLLMAASWGYNDILELLVKNGADMNHTSINPYIEDWESTPLKGAAAWGYDDTVQVRTVQYSAFSCLVAKGTLELAGRDQSVCKCSVSV